MLQSMAWLLLLALVAMTRADSASEGDLGHDLNVVSMEGKNVARAESGCWECYLSVHKEDCIHMKNNFVLNKCQQQSQQNYCAVEWLKTNGEYTTFERKCAESCTKENQDMLSCEKAGEDYEKCYQCCEGPYCNKEFSGAAEVSATSTIISTMLLLFIAICLS